MAGLLLITQLSQGIVNAEASEPYLGKTTGYILKGTTASGEEVRSGICASSEKNLGKKCLLYLVNEDGSKGKEYMLLECKDTGGDELIKEGKLIDVWFPSLEEAKEHMRVTKGNVYIQIIE